MREKIACWSVRLRCCALCRLSCVVDVLLTFLSYGFKEKGKRKDTTENQTPSAVIDMHVCKLAFLRLTQDKNSGMETEM